MWKIPALQFVSARERIMRILKINQPRVRSLARNESPPPIYLVQKRVPQTSESAQAGSHESEFQS